MPKYSASGMQLPVTRIVGGFLFCSGFKLVLFFPLRVWHAIYMSARLFVFDVDVSFSQILFKFQKKLLAEPASVCV